MRDDLVTAMLILCMFLAAIGGYVAAHDEVARECKRLGGFYVGSEVFMCRPIEEMRK